MEIQILIDSNSECGRRKFRIFNQWWSEFLMIPVSLLGIYITEIYSEISEWYPAVMALGFQLTNGWSFFRNSGMNTLSTSIWVTSGYWTQVDVGDG